MAAPFRLTSFSDLRLSKPGPRALTGTGQDGRCLTAHFRLDADVSALFPFIKAEYPDAVRLEKPCFIRFVREAHLCGLHTDHGAASPFCDPVEAADFIHRLIDYLRNLHARRHTLQPDYRTYRRPSVPDIYRLLPGTNCGECGQPTCMAFAAALSRHKCLPEDCPGLSRPISEAAVYPVHDRDGRLLRTVRLDMDLSRLREDLQSHRRRIAVLEDKLQEKAASSTGQELPKLPVPLTTREMEVLRLLAGGSTNTEISQALYISPHTVKSHVIHIFNKLGVNDRTQAAVWAVKNRLI